ncbi:MAG: short-chain dehydrogenase [Chlamydiales bacterium 38-26]|nr:mycofactocin-coupled SDR family oxidoreductase [Chlamydiales bacterium]OJV10783.1 MAG: short-chain dehydrogenase [Chlamydiales bacterium 38-26]
MQKQREGSQNRIAIITGAARGIGRAAAIALAKQGVDIVGIDICAPVCKRSGVKASTPDDLVETGKRVEAEGRRWKGEIQDQRDLSALRNIAKHVEEEWGGIDILFANAGIQEFRPLLELDDLEWQTHLDVNLTGTANTIRAFAPYLVKKGWGRIIVTGSTQGRHGTKYGAAYSASKWGIIGLMKSAALELGPYGITVNAIIPGLINTPLTRHEERFAQILEDAGKQPTGNLEDEKLAEQILTVKTPLNVPWIEPEDVASVVVFLASDAARMVSGATYDVTAGDSAHYM